MKKILLLLWFCSLPAAAQQHVEHLLDLMARRLALAPTVAEVKWNNHLPIEDPAREEQLLQGVPENERAFLQAQFEASKQIQQQCRENWVRQHSGAFASAPTLAEIRVQLDKLTSDMLAALEEARAELAQPGMLDNALKRYPADTDAWSKALEPLR